MSRNIKTSKDCLLTPFVNTTPTVINKGAGVELPPVSNDRHTANQLPSKHDTSTRSSYIRILYALQIAPQTTVEFRELWGVMSPAQRIAELRQQGHVIIKTPVYAYTADGVKHDKVAKYVLVQLAPHFAAQAVPSISKQAANDPPEPLAA
jgi:hypothetical protein